MSTSKFRSFLAAARVANLPGVASHTFAGVFVAAMLAPPANPLAWTIALIVPSGVLLCLAGNLLNDWHDRAWDARHRPERALPAGHFRPSTFLATGIVTGIGGIALAAAASAAAGAVALAIALCVACYTRWHKSSVWTIIPLAACRGLLPLLGAMAAAPGAPPAAIVAGGLALGLAVAGLSFDARGESLRPSATRPPWWPRVLMIGAIPVAAGLGPLAAIPAALPALAWVVFAIAGPPRLTAKTRVSALLAGLPLLDLPVLAHAHSAAPPMMATVALAVPAAAFFAGRILQRAASAT